MSYLNISRFLSIARIAATIGIFTFHFLGLSGLKNEGIDTVSIIIFCFLTGYLSFGMRTQPLSWLYKRIFSIMIPYWFVIIPVVLINDMVQYKKTSFLMDLITVLGGNLFLEHPIYVIAWYITFIILLYLFIFFQSIPKNIVTRVIIWVTAWVFFSAILHTFSYFISFALGFFGARIIPLPKKESLQMGMMDTILFIVQANCYAFFLINPGVLLFLSVNLKVTGFNLFCLGILLSSIGAIILQRITKPLIIMAANKALHLTPISLRSIGTGKLER